MSEEELQSKMEFIVNQQAQFAANFQKHEEAQANADERADKRLARLERVVKLIIRTGARERKDFRERYAALLDSQIKTEDTVHEISATVSELSATVSELTKGLKATKELTERNSEAILALTQIVGRIAQKDGDSA